MLFNSDVFLVFLAGFLLLYYVVRGRLAWRNGLIVAASYTFYGWWDWRLMSLLAGSSLLDYGVGQALMRSQSPVRRRCWLGFSLIGNLSLLGFFKYFGFFYDSLALLLSQIGFEPHARTWQIILPVGISFYTFQTLSYTIDIYRRQMAATGSLLDYLAYVAFFPQLVAGPIERAQHLLPQFGETRHITRAGVAEGIRLILGGMFLKVVVADNLAPLADLAYGLSDPAAPVIVLGTLAFGIQIYADFAGYSDIARGLARLLGFELSVNFRWPYLAGNVREFWHGWHISLSTWLRDYLYISLGGSRRGPGRTRVNLFLTMLLGGLWHGAAWHYVLWGAWHGAGLLVHRAWRGNRPGSESRLARKAAWAGTMLFVFYGWLLFRAESIGHAVSLTLGLADWSWPAWGGSLGLNLLVFGAPVIIGHWVAARKASGAGSDLGRAPGGWDWVVQGVQLAAIGLFWGKQGTPFIYFQF